MNFSSRCMCDKDWSALQFFKENEFKFPDKMGYEFILWLDQTRSIAQVSFDVISDYRSPVRNDEIGGAKDSAHMDIPCDAVDLRVTDNAQRFAIVRAALSNSCTRIGLYPNGNLHIDRTENTRPAKRI